MPRLTWWRVLSTVLGIVAVAAAILVMLADDEARGAIELLAVPTLALTLFLAIASVTGDSLQFHAVLPDSYRRSMGMWRWHYVFATGRLLNLLVPQAGAAYRAAQLRLEHGIPVATFYGAVAATTGVGAAVSWVLAGVIVIAGAPVLGSVVLALGVAALLGFAVMVRRLGRVVGTPTGEFGRVRRVAHSFAAGFVDLAHRRRFTRVLAISLLSQLFGALVYVVASDALGVRNPIVAGAALYAGTSVATVVSLTPGGLGLTELAAGLSAYFIDLGPGVGVLVALVARVIGILAVLLLAGTAALASRRRSGRHRA